MGKTYIYSAEYRKQKNKEYYNKNKTEILAKRKSINDIKNKNKIARVPKYIEILN
jgi:hypothetical protein